MVLLFGPGEWVLTGVVLESSATLFNGVLRALPGVRDFAGDDSFDAVPFAGVFFPHPFFFPVILKKKLKQFYTL